MNRARTKQVCTIGPASLERIPQMVAAGMDVARVNFSHGTDEEHKAYAHAVRAAAHSARRSVAVMADLPGPKLRLGELAGGEARLETGKTFTLRPDDGTPGDASGASVAHPEVTRHLEVGDRVLLADGAAELRVASLEGDVVTTEIVNGGLVRSRGGVNVPSQLLPADGPRIVVKIETRAGVDNFDEIAAEADGVMVARGDLGVDLPFEDVPLVQKDLVRRATTAGKFVIVATQMLESMTGAPRPTRAEVSDVANAVLDGADAVMLSAESAIGQFPVETLEAMERICAKAEADGDAYLTPSGYVGGNSAADAIIGAATYVSMRDSAGPGIPDAIWCFTRTGRTAELLSLARPGVPIVAFTLSPIVARRLAVRRAVTPVVLSANSKSGSLIERMDGAWRSQRGGNDVKSVLLVTTSQNPAGINRLEVHQLGGAAER